MITDYHAKLFANQLSRRHSVGDSEKLASTLLDAQVDLNPHQVEAALFAFKSPFSKGAILADEVGLGKTIEAGLLLSQKWTEGKRRIIIIGPANLRKQWSQEIEEKFFLPTLILEAKNYNKMIKSGVRNPFEQKSIIICSFQFAARHADELMVTPLDLAVLDEAHRLRNVYRPDNKMGKALKEALINTPKVLLTATPLQNSLLELYGLVSIIDDYAFGDLKSFRSQYTRITGEDQFAELKQRLKPICHRTLRRQVLEYIKYTNRIPITQEFIPSEEEQTLYDMVSDYLRRPSLNALPSSQRTLMTLIMRKLLASSTFAIAGALDSLSRKLERQIKDDSEIRNNLEEDDGDSDFDIEISRDVDGFEEEAEEWIDDEFEAELLTDDEIIAIEKEIEDLKAFRDLAISISENAKGQALLEALKAGIEKASELDAAQKAIIFTESRRTQEYLQNLLTQNGYEGKLVLFNGSNSDPQSKAIYEQWVETNKGSDKVSGSRTADIRAALVDHFRSNNAQIMIATEAAAEGINLQFCSIVVNYDLPWNPQRIEQRIGRCHRYGQLHDVVVINFLNKNNAADQRVYELLSEKFHLFSGVFGASDEVLGVVESGVEFEKRVIGIYQNCRTSEEIETAFSNLQEEMADRIDETMQNTRKKLLENFDAEVHDRLKVNLDEAKEYINRYERLLWQLTKHELKSHASFDDGYLSFILKKKINGLDAPTGAYYLTKKGLDGHRYRLGHPIAQHLLVEACNRSLSAAEITFNYSAWQQKASSIEGLVRQSGTLTVHKLSISGIDEQDHIIFAGQSDAGEKISAKAIARFFELPVNGCKPTDTQIQAKKLAQYISDSEGEILEELRQQKSTWFAEESQKLEKWADDKIAAAEKELVDVKNKVKELKREVRSATDPEVQHKLQVKIQESEKSKRRLRQQIFEVEDDILERRDDMIADIEARLKQEIEKQELFTIRWTVV
ncbi:MAG: DEAD/DEAH box helicase [Kordiimonas sp.]|nr:DEAD/DEAH box helicase [Kordiimonas sp.]